MADKFGHHVERLYAVAASPSRRLLAVGGERDVPTPDTVQTQVHISTLPKMEPERSISVTGSVYALCFASDELLLAGMSSGAIAGWDASSDKKQPPRLLSVADAHNGAVRCLATDTMGSYLASVGDDGRLRVGMLESTSKGVKFKLLGERVLSRRGLRAVAIDPQATIVAAAGDDGVIRTLPLDQVTEASPREMPCGEGGVYALCFTGDGRIAAGCGDGSLHLCYLEGAVDDENRSRDAGHTAPVRAVQYSLPLLDSAKRPIGRRLFTLAEDGELKSWVLDTKRRPKTIKVSGVAQYAMTLVPAGKGTKAVRRGGTLVMVGHDRRISLSTVTEQAEASESFVRVLSYLKELNKNLRASSEQVRKRAVDALGTLEEDEARALLDRALSGDRRPDVKKRAAEVIGKSHRRLSRPALRAALNDQDKGVRKAALDALSTIEKDAPLSPVRAALKSSHPDIRVTAVKRLPGLRAVSPLVPGLIAGSLQDSSSKVRVAALDALYELSGSDTVEPVRIAMSRGPADIRKEALLRLGRARKTDDPIGRGLLEGGIDDDDADVRQAAFLISIGARTDLASRVRSVDEKTRKALTDLEKEGQFSDSRRHLLPIKLSDEDRQPLFAALTCRNADIATRAARTLGLLGDSRATGALLQLSRESNVSVRRATVEAIEAAALAMPGDDRLTARLQWLLDDGDATVRSLSFEALETLSEPRQAEGRLDLAALSLRCAEQDIRLRSLKILAEFGGKGKHANSKALSERADGLLGDALDDESSTVRTEAFNTLWAWYSKNPQIPLTRGIDSRHADVRVRVVSELARLKKRPPGEWADNALLALIGDSSAKVGKAAYDALTDKKTNTADARTRASVHRAALDSTRPSVRVAGCKGAPKKIAKDVRDRLVELVRDEHRLVHIAAIEALDRLVPTDAEGFAAAFASVHYNLRVRACELCGKRRDARAVSPAKELLTIPETRINRPSEELRVRAARALADVGDRDSIAFYVSLLEDGNALIRETGARGLATACRPGDEKPLVEALSHDDLPVRSWVAEGLARLGDERAVPVLAGTLGHDHKPLRMGAIMGFVALGSDGVRGILLGLEDREREIQDLVFAVVVARDVAQARAGIAPDLLLSAMASSAPEIRFAAARILESRIAGKPLSPLARQLVGPRKPAKASEMKDWPEENERTRRLQVLVDALASDHPVQRYAATQVLTLRAQPLAFWREAARLIGPSAASRPRIPYTNWEDDEAYQPRKKGWIHSLFSQQQEEDRPSLTERVLRVIKFVGGRSSRSVPKSVPFTDTHARRLSFGTYAGLIRQAPARGDSDTTHRVRRDSIDRLAVLALADDVGKSAVLPVLRRALSDPHHLVRKAAVSALARLYGADSHEPHRLALQASAADVGRGAVDALVASALAGDKDAAVLAKGAIDAPVSEVRSYAMAQMPRLFDSDSLDPWLIALGSMYADVRLSVVDRLVDSTDSRVSEALGRAMESDHEDLRLKAAVALARRGDVRTVDVLAGILRSEDARTAQKATDALIALAHARPLDDSAAEVAAAAATAVAARLEDDPDKTANRNALMDALGRIGSPAGGDVLLGVLAEEDTNARMRGFRTLMNIAKDKTRGVRVHDDGTKRDAYNDKLALRYLRVAASSKDLNLRLQTTEMLRHIDDMGAEALLARMVEDREEPVRVSACESLAFRAEYIEGATIDALSSTLRSGRRELVLPAAAGLASRRRPEAFQALLLVFKASAQEERERAILALGTLGDRRALEELEPLLDTKAELEDEDKELVPTIVEALGRMLPRLEDTEEHGDELSRIRELVERTAREGALDLRMRALTGLRHAGDARSRALLEQVARDEHDDSDARQHAAEELGMLGDPASESALAELLSDEEYYLRHAALESLQRIFPKEPTRTSLHALNSSHDDISAPAAGFLSRRGDPSVLVAKLSAIASEDVRLRIRRGLIRRGACPVNEVRALLTGDAAGPRADAAWIAGASGDNGLADAVAKAVSLAAAQWAHAKAGMAGAHDDANRTLMRVAEEGWRASLWAGERLGAKVLDAAREVAPDRTAPASVRTEALRIVAERGKASDVSRIAPCLSDASAEIRAVAAAAVAALAPDQAADVLANVSVADAAALGPMVEAALTAKSNAAAKLLAEDSGRQLALPVVLGTNRSQELAKLAGKKGKGSARLVAVATLGRMGGDEARVALQKILDNKSEEDAVRAAAFKAMRRLQRKAAHEAAYRTEEASA